MAQRIREVKRTLGGERKTFDCELLHRTDDEVVVIYRMPRDIQLEDILLRKDTVSLGYFWRDRPYNAYHWIDQCHDTLALYFNIADGTRISSQSVEWRDLAVDILLTPDGRCRVLDEDELPTDIEPALRSYINRARDELCQQPLSRLAEYDKLTRSLMNRE